MRFQQATEQQPGDQSVNTLSDLGILSAAIIHEVKNSLQGVENALYLLDNDPALSRKARERVAIARRELSRAFDISKQTLTLVREEQPVTLALIDVLENILQVYAQKIAHKQITVERRYEFREAIQSNPAIQQVFANIILNALEAVPFRTGKLVIHTYPTSRCRGANLRGVQIVFADNGPGIPEELKTKVFEPLYSTKTGKGSGLGLWVAGKLVRKYRGHLRVHSKSHGANSGCCFAVFLPLSPYPPATR